MPTADDIEPITNAIWWQIGALVCLGGAFWLHECGNKVQALLLTLVAIGLALNWARIYPWT
ncbi:hypothetical protein CN171_34620 [Sinorhizobium meliloti]|nr:hypothetical protein CN175_33580 [Sinorhizobium meliloti]RVJ64324.1 hypothetical protein CN171_34620 [Sinorhizobium meliloti]RVJ86726.1 hypothetical protein CN169_27045 [Sinorhizobium meliloti]